jgi:hypothetical protein
MQLQLTGDLPYVVRLLGPDERDPDAGLTGAGCAADAVHVAVPVLGRVEVDDMRYPLDVNAASGNVCGDEDVHATALEVE